jgi:hypothetical protein
MINCVYCGAKDVEPIWDNRYHRNIPTEVEARPIDAERACPKCKAYAHPVNACLEGLTIKGELAVRK